MLPVRHHYHFFINNNPFFLIFIDFSPIAELHVPGKTERWWCRVVARLARYALEQPKDNYDEGDYGDSNDDDGDGNHFEDNDYYVDEDVDGTLGGMCKPPRALDVVEAW